MNQPLLHEDFRAAALDARLGWLNPPKRWRLDARGLGLVNAQGFNEGKGKPFTYEDIRFATKGDVLYATALGWPQDGKLIIKSLAKNRRHFPKEIQRVEWVPAGQPLLVQRTETELAVSLPENNADTYACVLKIL